MLAFEKKPKPQGGELIVFWENGLVPYKNQTYFSFSILPGRQTGIFSVVSEELNLALPLDLDISQEDEETASFSDLEIFNVAFPKYIERPPFYLNAEISTDSVNYEFQLTEDYQTIAFKTLKDRILREIGKVATRLATKKLSEYLLSQENEGLGAALSVFNALSEKADTRNWQSLPAHVYYCRIPLKTGENNISIRFNAPENTTHTEVIKVNSNGGLQFRKVITLKSLATPPY